MRTVEVAETQWEHFCQRLEQLCQGGLISLELVETDGRASPVVKDAPLRRVLLDAKSDPCNLTLLIETGGPTEKPQRHRVFEPIHLRLKDSGEDGRYHRLHILAENGTTIMEFHPGFPAESLKEFYGVSIH